jgi:hypothetical protein
MPRTYEPIATQTLTSTVSTVVFSSIPQTYTDLELSVSSLGDSATASVNVRFNSDSGSNYSVTRIYGNGSAAASNRYSSQTSLQIGDYQLQSGSEVPLYICKINSYSNSTTNKTTLSRSNTTSYWVSFQCGLWRNTAAINSITFVMGSGSFISGSVFTIYGIKAA